MTEEEWLSGTDVKTMLRKFRYLAGDRKVRLFTCACGRRNLHRMEQHLHRDTMNRLERYADDLAHIGDLESILLNDHPVDPFDADDIACSFEYDPYQSACHEVDAAIADACLFGTTAQVVRVMQCSLLRDIVGNPFQSVIFELAWLAWNDRAAVKIAQQLYDDRAFDSIGILADALEDAGCHNESILQHCRGEGPHIRGCWVVDRLLGKK